MTAPPQLVAPPPPAEAKVHERKEWHRPAALVVKETAPHTPPRRSSLTLNGSPVPMKTPELLLKRVESPKRATPPKSLLANPSKLQATPTKPQTPPSPSQTTSLQQTTSSRLVPARATLEPSSLAYTARAKPAASSPASSGPQRNHTPSPTTTTRTPTGESVAQPGPGEAEGEEEDRERPPMKHSMEPATNMETSTDREQQNSLSHSQPYHTHHQDTPNPPPRHQDTPNPPPRHQDTPNPPPRHQGTPYPPLRHQDTPNPPPRHQGTRYPPPRHQDTNRPYRYDGLHPGYETPPTLIPHSHTSPEQSLPVHNPTSQRVHHSSPPQPHSLTHHQDTAHDISPHRHIQTHTQTHSSPHHSSHTHRTHSSPIHQTYSPHRNQSPHLPQSHYPTPQTSHSPHVTPPTIHSHHITPPTIHSPYGNLHVPQSQSRKDDKLQGLAPPSLTHHHVTSPHHQASLPSLPSYEHSVRSLHSLTPPSLPGSSPSGTAMAPQSPKLHHLPSSPSHTPPPSRYTDSHALIIRVAMIVKLFWLLSPHRVPIHSPHASPAHVDAAVEQHILKTQQQLLWQQTMMQAQQNQHKMVVRGPYLPSHSGLPHGIGLSPQYMVQSGPSPQLTHLATLQQMSREPSRSHLPSMVPSQLPGHAHPGHTHPGHAHSAGGGFGSLQLLPGQPGRGQQYGGHPHR